MLNAPMLRGEEDHFYYAAWNDLATCRAFAGGAIPWTAVKAYCDAYELEDFDFVWQVVNAVDLHFIMTAAKPEPTKEKL